MARLRMHRVFLLLVALLVSGGARAGDTTLAETLFREGKTLMDKGKYDEACPKLEESFIQDPASGTLLALAVCQERAGKLASAWATYTDAAIRAHQDGQPDREGAARERAEALAPRLSRLTVEVPAPVASLPGLKVTRDGVPLPAAAWGTAVPIDPGQHSVEVSASGKRTFRQTLEIGREPQQKVVKVPVLEDETPAAAALAPSATPSGAPRPELPLASESATGGGFSLRTLGLIVGGAGVVGLGAGTFFAVKAKGLDSDSNANGHCDDTGCDPEGMDKRNDARSAGDLATVFFVAGFALVGGGSALYVLSDEGNAGDGRSARLRVRPRLNAREAGVSISGAWE